MSQVHDDHHPVHTMTSHSKRGGCGLVFLFGRGSLPPPLVPASPHTEHDCNHHHHHQVQHQKHLIDQHIAARASEQSKLVEVDDEIDSSCHPDDVEREADDHNDEANDSTDLGPLWEATAQANVRQTAHTTAEDGEGHYYTCVLWREGGREGGKGEGKGGRERRRERREGGGRKGAGRKEGGRKEGRWGGGGGGS